MPTPETLDERLRAVERALTGTDCDLTTARDAGELAAAVESHADRLDALDSRIEELEAATLALRGYVGNVKAVNDDVERRAEAALAAAESFEAELESFEAELNATDATRSESDSPDGEPAHSNQRATGRRRDEFEQVSDPGRRPESGRGNRPGEQSSEDRDRSEESTRGLLARLAGVS